MKLAAIYNVWDGEELLQGSINQIRNHVDLVIVVWQDVSNLGESYLPQLDLSGVDKFIQYVPVLHAPAAQNETKKRNIGLHEAKALGATHFICLDCDEYYISSEFEAAKKQVLEGDCDSSACQLYTYYNKPTLRLEPPETYFVPFIHKIQPGTKMGLYEYPVFADPTRRVNIHKRFLRLGYLMHHFSFVRKDIGRKFRNSSSRQAYKNWENLAQRFENGELVHFQGNLSEVNNIFNIHI